MPVNLCAGPHQMLRNLEVVAIRRRNQGGNATRICRVDAGAPGQGPSHTLDIATSCGGDQGMIAQVSGAFLGRREWLGGPCSNDESSGEDRSIS